MEEQNRCVHEAGEWLGRSNTPGEVTGFGRRNSRGVLKEADDNDDDLKKGSV